jgi:hypothetical protein
VKHIIWTRPDGGVMVTVPSSNCIRWLETGGRWLGERVSFVDEQIERHIADGHMERVAVSWCRGLQNGGVARRDAIELIRDRDCRGGVAHELIDPSDLTDRWFREAWRRSHNGGPIWLDVEACRVQQWGRIKALADAEAAKLRPREMNLGALRDAILSADEPDDIRRIWPHGT